MLISDYSEIKKLQNLLDDFSKATGFVLAILENNNESVTSSLDLNHQFCIKPLAYSKVVCKECSECKKKWQKTAKERKKSIVYTCRTGIIEFIDPILVDNETEGFLFGGQIIVGKNDAKIKPFETKSTGQILSPDKLEMLDREIENGGIIMLPREWYERKAKEFDLKPEDYLKAIGELPFFTEEKFESYMKIIKNLSEYIAIMMAKWKNEKRTQKGLMDIISDMKGEFDRSPEKVGKIMEDIAKLSISEIGADIVTLYQFYKDQNLFIHEFSNVKNQLDGSMGKHVRVDDLVYEIAHKNEENLISDPDDIDMQGNPNMRTLIKEKGIKSIALEPIGTEGEVLGVLMAGYYEPKDLNNETITRIKKFILQVSMILQIVQLKKEKKSTVIEKMTEISEEILKEFMGALSCTRAAFTLIKDDKRFLLYNEGIDNKYINPYLSRPISKDKLIMKVVNGKEPYILSNVADDPDWESTEGTDMIKSWICVPLFYDRKVVSLITMDHTDPGFFKAGIKEKLASLAGSVSPKMRYILLLENSRMSIRNTRIVRNIGEMINSKLDYKELLVLISNEITDQLDCTHCTVYLYGNDPEFKKNMLIPQDIPGKSAGKLKFDPEAGLAGKVFVYGETQLWDNAKDDPDFIKGSDKSKNPRSLIIAPIKVGDQTIGVICADKEAYGWFGEDEKQLVSYIAIQAGIAVQRCKGLTLLKEIGNDILNLNVDINNDPVKAVLEKIYKGAIELANVTTGVIYLLNENGREVLYKYHPSDFDYPLPRLDKDDGITRTIFKTGVLQEIRDTSKDGRINPVLVDFYKSMIGLPLKIKDRVIGVLFLDDEDRHDFTETEKTLLMLLADQAANAIQNLNLLNYHKHLENQFEKVNQIIEELDMDKVLDRIVDGIYSILGNEVTTTINLYDRENDRFGDYHANGPLKAELNVPPRNDGTARHVLKTGQPYYLPDVDAGEVPTICDASKKFGIKSFTAIPLKQGRDIVGILFVNSKRKLEFTDEIKRILEIFANQATVAITNIRFVEKYRSSLAMTEKRRNGLQCLMSLNTLNSNFFHIVNNQIGFIRQQIDKIRNILSQEMDIKMTVEILDKIDVYITTIYNMIDRVSDMKEDANEKISRVNLKKLIDYAYEKISSKLISNGKIRIIKTININSDCFIETFEKVMAEAIYNILDNAVESIIDSGTVSLDCKRVSDNVAIISISDTGKGISKEAIAKIYDNDYTTKKYGTGYGLYFVKAACDATGANINVLSELNKGTIFNLEIPTII